MESTPIDAKILLQYPIFQGLSEDKLNQFLTRTQYSLRSYPADTMIFVQEMQCNFLDLLIEGRVKALMMNGEGKQVTIEDMTSPRVIAPAALYASNNYYPVNIQSITDCKILFLEKSGFEDLMHRESIVMMNYIRILSDKSIFLSKKINTFALQTLKGRLASYLLNQEQHQTQQEIAEKLGVTRPSLARVLAELIDEGCIKIESRKIEIVDKARLKRYEFSR